MSKPQPIVPAELPRAAISRLSLYLRQLDLVERSGQSTISSRELGDLLGLSDSQVRKDLAYFGQFGRAGVGYRVADLKDALRGVLGVDKTWRAALVGVGNLGRALLGYQGFLHRGFKLVAAFDCDPAIVGAKLVNCKVHSIENLDSIVRKESVDLGILAVPADAAQGVANALVGAGVQGILNFAPTTVKVPRGVSVVSVDLGLQLEQLVFQVNQQHPTRPKQSAG